MLDPVKVPVGRDADKLTPEPLAPKKLPVGLEASTLAPELLASEKLMVEVEVHTLTPELLAPEKLPVGLDVDTHNPEPPVPEILLVGLDTNTLTPEPPAPVKLPALLEPEGLNADTFTPEPPAPDKVPVGDQILYKDVSVLLKERNLSTISLLSDEDKFYLLTNNNQPEEGKICKSADNRCRGFRKKYCDRNLGRHFHYSTALDKLFCLACAFYPPTDIRYFPKTWIQTGFSNWAKAQDKSKGIPLHESSQHHMSAMLSVSRYLDLKKGQVSKSEEQFNKIRVKEEEERMIMLNGVISVTKLLAQQGLPFRGHREEEDLNQPDENHGNFLECVDLLGQHNFVIQKKMEKMKQSQALHSGRGTTTLVSKTTQNEIIEILGDIVMEEITRKVKEAKYFVIIADEASVCSSTYLSICLRYLADEELHEDFFALKLLTKADAKTITESIVKEIQKAGLSMGKYSFKK